MSGDCEIIDEGPEPTLLERAIHFAVRAHHGQPDKVTGEPYIFHPLRVMERARGRTRDERVWAVAVLHDVLEDTPTSEEELIGFFGESIAKAVRILSNMPGDHESYEAFIRYCKRTPVTKLVKTCDIEDHLSRLPDPDQRHAPQEIKWRQKYEGAMAILSS